jgi:hypothetical protein
LRAPIDRFSDLAGEQSQAQVHESNVKQTQKGEKAKYEEGKTDEKEVDR